MGFLQARVVCVAFLLSTACSIQACLWDNDTLRHESEEFPGLIEVATGWFERNPPLYYQMRLDRMKTVIEKTPADLEAYDNAAVAADRLGDDRTALSIIAKKKAQLTKIDPAVKSQKEHWYRFYANEGTFYVHLWIRDGKKPDQKNLLRQSIADLKRVLEINPDAHFGRETVQLALIESMLHGQDVEFDDRKFSREQILKGLQGLVVLGNAWESSAVFEEMAAWAPPDKANLANLLSLRAGEIAGIPTEDVHILTTGNTKIRENFKMLREAAEAEHQRREVFMLEKLKRGLHPDTDPTFWNGFVPAKPPEFIESTPNSVRQREEGMKNLYLYGTVTVVLVALIVGVLIASRNSNRSAS